MALAAAASGLRELIARARALVFDFDGTLVDSNPIKFRAFERCFEDLDEHREAALAYCLGHHHTPRDEKFRHVYEQILKLPYTAQVEQALLSRFAEQTTQPIVEAPETPGAERFLEWASSCFATGVLSSTPDPVLREILRGRAWGRFFLWIRGAPVDKAVWLSQLLQKEGFRGEEVVFLGDTEEDRKAASGAGCLFVAVRADSGFHDLEG